MNIVQLARQIGEELAAEAAAGLVTPPKRKRLGRREERRDAKRRQQPSLNSCEFGENPCCQGLRCHEKYDASTVRDIRHAFAQLTSVDRRQFVADRILMHRKRRRYFLDLVPSTMHIQNMVSPEARPQCCLSWFLFVLGVSKSFIYQYHIPDPEFRVHTPGRQHTTPEKRNYILMWLRQLAQWACMEPDNDIYALPFGSWSDVYYLLCDESAEHAPRYSYFMTVKEDRRVSNIILRKYLRFAKCDDCVGFRQRRAETRDPKTLAKLRSDELKHKRFVRDERSTYWFRRKRAIRFPAEYLSVIMDGADQSAFGVPHFREKDHLTQGCANLTVRLMGIIVHGVGCWAYTYLDHVRSGANATLDCLVRTLTAIKAAGEGRSLPRKLYLQLDNTCKQNKNRFVIAWMCFFVEYNIFEEVTMSFLPVGHTHEDIDQMFSRFAIALRKRDFATRQALGEIVKTAYHLRTGEAPQVEHLTRFTNLSEYIDPYIVTSRFLGSQKYRQFRISKTIAGQQPETVVRARVNCANKEQWTAISGPRARTRPWKEQPPPLVLEHVPLAQCRGMDDDVGNGVRHSTKVKKITNGVNCLIERKGVSAADARLLREELRLMADPGELGNDLPGGANAMRNLVSRRNEPDAGALGAEDVPKLMSGYEVEKNTFVAVLVNAEEVELWYERWDLARVTNIDLDLFRREGGASECISVQWCIRKKSRRKADVPKFNLPRESAEEVTLEPAVLQCQVYFTQLGGVTKKAVDELGIFLAQAQDKEKEDTSCSEEEDMFGDE